MFLSNSLTLTLIYLIQVEKAQSGLKSLSLSQKTTNMLRENFVEIEKYEDDRLYKCNVKEFMSYAGLLMF